MKRTILVISFLITSSVFAQNCDSHNVRKNIEKHINSSVGTNAGGSDKILKVENIDVLASDDQKGDIRVLFTYSQTIGKSLGSADNSVFEMKGYAKFQKKTCKRLDYYSLGSFRLVD